MLPLHNLNTTKTDENKKSCFYENWWILWKQSVKASCLKKKKTDTELAVGKRIMKSEEKFRRSMH